MHGARASGESQRLSAHSAAVNVLRELSTPVLPAASAADGERLTSPSRVEADLRGTPWWLWPHLWSLDAPLVAVTWQQWWARSTGTRMTWPEGAVLALAVWMIYLADRLVDSGRHCPTEHGTARHAFYRRRRAVVRPLVVSVGLGLTAATPTLLSAPEFAAGLALLALAAGYFWMTHRWTWRPWTALWPKEAAVGGLFALGSFLFVEVRAAGYRGTVPWALLGFAILCFLNCALITRWESSQRDRRDPGSLTNAFPRLVKNLGWGCWLLAAASLGGWCSQGDPVFLPLAASAVLLGLLDRKRLTLSVDALRVWADVVLLTPWCFFAWVR